jgi:hypothetical protein
MRTITKAAPLSDSEVAALKDQFLDRRHFDLVIGGTDTTVIGPDGEPVLVYRYRVPEVWRGLEMALPALRAMPKGSQQRKDKSQSKDNPGRAAKTGILGFMTPTPREPWYRATMFTREFPELYETCLPLLQALEAEARAWMPARHAFQAAVARQTSAKYLIDGTSFTTGTVNELQRFKAHRDKNNLPDGVSAMTVWRQGPYLSGHLVFPRWRLAFRLGCGDVLLFDGADMHGNSGFENEDDDESERFSVIAYYLKGMIDAPSH